MGPTLTVLDDSNVDWSSGRDNEVFLNSHFTLYSQRRREKVWKSNPYRIIDTSSRTLYQKNYLVSIDPYM